MALHITNPEVEQQVRDLALQRGESITEVIGIAVKQLRFHSEQFRKPRPTVEEMVALIDSFASGPIDYSKTEDEILGYGPDGLPE